MKLPRQRLLEILPGLLSWSLLFWPFFLSFTAPVVVILFVLFYAVYWLMKALVMSYHLIIGYKLYKKAITTDWLAELDRLSPPGKWHDIWHVVIIPMSKEESPILESTLAALAASRYPLGKLMVVLAIEGRYSEHGRAVAHSLQGKYGNKFAFFTVTEHPAGLPGEVRGKGPNITWAGHEVAKLIAERKIEPRNVIVTTLDADNRVHTHYLAALTHAYLTDTDPTHKSYQPISMYFNNIWQVPMAVRVVSLGSSFWQMIESTRPHRLRNFSAHAQSLQTLLDTNFWSVRTIVEDGHQFWRTYAAYGGQHRVVPIYVPVYQDAVLSPHGFWATMKAQYLQRRRWAWGASDVAYVGEHLMQMYQKTKRIPWQGILQWLRLVEGHVSLSTTSLVLAMFGWLPLLVNPELKYSIIRYSFPVVYSRLLTSAWIGLLITMILTAILLPQRPRVRLGKLRMIGEWFLTPLLLPITNIIFGAFPAIDAQTRLMFGKYMTSFYVTPKATTSIIESHSALPTK